MTDDEQNYARQKMKEETNEFEHNDSPHSGDDKEQQSKFAREISATRDNLQVGRRLFHMANGAGVATAYAIFVTHQQLVHTLGIIACLVYLFEQIRINYPEYAEKFSIISHYFLRAEEQLEESSAIPYVMAILLTILSFPKFIAIAAIYTLAFADPLSAIVGIKFGKHQFVKGKSIEGSTAFFITTFVVVIGVFFFTFGDMNGLFILLAFLVALFTSLFEMIPIRLDDNLTIPLFTASLFWILCALFEVTVI